MEEEITPAEVTEEVTAEPLETETPEESTDESPVEDSTEERLILGKYKSVEEVEKSLILQQQENAKLRESLKDPNFVYDQARRLGLTEEQAQAEADKVDIGQVVKKEVETLRDYDKALEIMPELATDAKLEAWASGLVQRGMTHTQAAKTIKDVLNKSVESARVEGAKTKELEVSEKEAAQTAPTIGAVDPDASEVANLREKAKSLNRVEQEAAMAEIIARNLKL